MSATFQSKSNFSEDDPQDSDPQDSNIVLIAGMDPTRRNKIRIALEAVGYHVIESESDSDISALGSAAVVVLDSQMFPRIQNQLTNQKKAASHLNKDAEDGTLQGGLQGQVGNLSGVTLAEIERQAIQDTLAACDGNKAKSARQLGISEKTIYNKMKRLKIDYPPQSSVD